jgi:hypothetical protein
MFGGEIGEKCIIMHFLVAGKDGKDRKRSLNAETLRARRKDLRGQNPG